MFKSVVPKLPMRDKAVTQAFYADQLGFSVLGVDGFPLYLMVAKDGIEMHFFLSKDLDPKQNDGQVYIRVVDIVGVYKSLINAGVAIHPNGQLTIKPWGQYEFSILDPDNNLLTFGESIE